jgi:hypothetical protein
MGGVIARDAVMEPFLEGHKMYSHGITFGGHPVQAAIALKNIEIMKRERIVEHVAEKQDAFRDTLAQLRANAWREDAEARGPHDHDRAEVLEPGELDAEELRARDTEHVAFSHEVDREEDQQQYRRHRSYNDDQYNDTFSVIHKKVVDTGALSPSNGASRLLMRPF